VATGELNFSAARDGLLILPSGRALVSGLIRFRRTFRARVVDRVQHVANRAAGLVRRDAGRWMLAGDQERTLARMRIACCCATTL
jgi:hypothetical protein